MVKQSIGSWTATSGGTAPIDAAGVRYFRITIDSDIGFTVGAPSHAVVGRRLTVELHNATSGSLTKAIGFATGAGGFKFSPWNALVPTHPIAGNRNLFCFEFDGTVWREVSRALEED